MTRIVTLGGVAGPLLFAVVVVICAAMRPGYSHVSQFISELGETGGANSALMNYAGFMLPGILMFLSGIGLAGRFRRTALGLLGSLLVAVFGAGVFGAGVFSCDPGCPPSAPTREALLHNLVSLIAFVAMIVGAALLGFRFRGMADWRGFANYSLATSALSAVLLATMIAIPAVTPVIGLVQRVFLGLVLLWLVLVSIRSARAG